MAYAALISLKQSLNEIMLQHSVVQREQIQSLLPKIEFLLEFLEDSSHKRDEKTYSWITRIRDAAYEAQNIVDLYCYDTEMAIIRHVPKPKNMDLENIIREIDAIESDIREQTGSKTEEEKNIENRLVPNDLQLQNSFRAGSPRLSSEDIMVGFEVHYLEIMKELTDNQQSELEFVSITGMGGIGKTTLAKNIYNHHLARYHFEIRAWVVASQSLRNILLNILDSMNMLSDEMHGQDENKLKELVFRTLKQRRYLIIIDDIWDTSVWDEMRPALPNNKYGSRVLLTTRLSDVAAYVTSSRIHHLSLLSSEESWILLGAKVFGNENCPPELQEIGQKISERCGGLPLSLVVMGGLLSRIDKTKEAWLNIEKNVFSDDLDPCLKILKLSYDHLPQQLKPCLLYMAHFQEEEEIPVSKVIKLWVAEGFLKQVQHQDPEAVAEKCLMELVDRSMILVSKHNSEGKIKTCRIHNLVLDLCIREANKEKFLCVMTPMYADTFQKPSHYHLRLSIHSKTPDLILSDSIPSFSYVRSLLYTGSGILSSSVFLKFKLLRVLDAIKVAFPNFPSELLNLRYISFTCLEHIPASISNLRNLQTLIIHQEHSLNLPVEIWNMAHLRHVEFIESSLLYPSGTQLGVDGSSLVLTNLRTLSGVRNLRFTEDLLARIPSIERLKISYDTLDEQQGWSYYEFQNLVNLQLLRQLKIYVVCDLDTLERWNLTRSEFEFQFPPSLKVLTLGGCSISWEDLSVVGCLPNLEVLKLRYRSCVGEHWRPNKGEFCRLKLLLLQSLDLVRWEIDPSDFPFPCLEQLILRDCYALEKIPYEIGEIPTLTKIELDKYNESVLASAENIQEFQFDLGDYDFQLVLRAASAESSSSNSLIHPEDFEMKQPTTPSLGQIGSFAVDSSRVSWDHGIKDWLLGSNYHLEVISIAGKAGIGKTTLARYLFEYPAIVNFYEIHAWVSVSRTNDVQKIIKGILESMRPIEDGVDDMSLAQLADTLYKRLQGKRYLIVLDDVWDIQVWDDIKRSFPDDNKWSRIILTTRLLEMDLKARFFKIHHMRLLTPRMSWTLFCMKVFGNEECPQELEYAAKQIVGSCRGLPLAIVVIGGLLSKISKTGDKWQLFADSMKSAISSKDQLKHILSLSYAYLPHHLIECLLVMIILGEDNYELSVPQIIRSLIAEGLAYQLDSKSSEDVAKEFLKDLIDRSLVMVCKQNKKGEVETCDIHSIWQDYFMAKNPDILQILLSVSKQSITPKEGMADLPRSSGDDVSMTIEEGQKGQTNRKENLEISMDILFNNRYTKDYIRYCTLFPASYEFTKDILVWLWIAQGGTIAGSGEFIEEVCVQFFDILLKLKYIVPTGYDPYGDQMKYEVGDEMNAFLQNHLIGSRFSKELDSKHIEESKLEHLSFKEIDQINFEIIKRLSHIQTLVIHGCYGFNIKQLPFDLFLELKELRILSFSHTDVMELPSSIKNSKELRFLDMSETPIRWLPESMCNLSNLQTLKLDNCLGLIRLPKRTKELINLRHLILDVARQLQSMPECIGNLSELRTLRTFLVGEDDGYNISELKSMNKLSGSLRILKLENVKTPDQATDASLGSKHFLKKIEFQWSDFQDEENPIEEDILACLEPTFRIQELKIFYYSGGKLPSWISKSSFSKLVSITLNKCRYCSNLPSLGQLPSLKFLSIIGMNEVLEINNLFYGEQVKDQPSFPMLEKLSFVSMFKLEQWTEIRIGDFPHLVNLIIESCPNINCLPSLSYLNSLIHMEISYCPELSCLPDGILPSTLEFLMIKDCPKLKERCSSDKGDDWPKIAHVPGFYIDSMKIHTK